MNTSIIIFNSIETFRLVVLVPRISATPLIFIRPCSMEITAVNSPETSITTTMESDSCPSLLELWKPALEAIMRSNDHKSISLALRFRFFQDEDQGWIKSILLKRSKPDIDTILRSIGISGKETLTRKEKVQWILSRPALKQTIWKWRPYGATDETNVYRISGNIAEEVQTSFQQIDFVDWVQIALGHSVESLGDFSTNLQIFSWGLYCYLSRHQPELEKYYAVKEILYEKCPFANTALSNSISPFQTKTPYSDPTFDFDFIIGPLRDLIRVHTEPLPTLLRRLSLLSHRFRHDCWDRIWTRRFRVETDFFDLLTQRPTVQIAYKLIQTDLQILTSIGLQNVMEDDEKVKTLNLRWNQLCTEVEECARAERLTDRIADVALLLCQERNFYSLTAILQGLRAAGAHHWNLAHLYQYVDPNDNYLAYRNAVKASPALPFLLPHLQEIQLRRKEACIEGLFIFSKYKLESHPTLIIAETNDSLPQTDKYDLPALSITASFRAVFWECLGFN